MKEFGVGSGDICVCRWCPSAINFRKVYLDKNGDMNKVTDAVIDGIINVHNHIKDIIATPKFHDIQIKKLYALSLILKEMDVQEYGTNAGEGSLCKSLVGRVCKFHDYVFPNQMQFCIGSTSANLLEHY
jgi:hypothetical protein